MDADLVGASGQGFGFEQGGAISKALQYFEQRAGVIAIVFINLARTRGAGLATDGCIAAKAIL